MAIYSQAEAKRRFSELIARARQGEEVLIEGASPGLFVELVRYVEPKPAQTEQPKDEG